jgi:glycosyltransferase involved in cell wall biosynthesis
MQELQLAALERSAAILTVSRTTAAVLVARGIEESRIYVTPNGLSPFPSPVEPPRNRESFVLLVGSLEPRKGHELLLEAVAREGLEEVRVVFAGPEVGRGDQIRRVAAELGVSDRLDLLGPVEDAVLAGLYRDAIALCLPSYGEGFGLPVLEAMSFGTPVVASDLPVLREVAADAALFAAVGDVDSLARELRCIVADRRLRDRLGRQGKERASLFTWDATAESTVHAYRVALSRACNRSGGKAGPSC